MKPDIKHEFNDGGTWYPALVETVEDENNAVFLVFTGGGWDRHKGSRGDESGQFRDKA